MIKNDLSKKFSKGTVGIHWITSILIIILFPMGKYMEELAASEKLGIIKVHFVLGMLVFILTLVRSILYFKSERPAPLKTGSKLNDKFAHWIHNIFYILLLLISGSGLGTIILGGYLEAFKTGNTSLILNHSEIPPLKGHALLSTIMMVLLALHIFGYLKHLLLTKENTLKRIWFSKNDS